MCRPAALVPLLLVIAACGPGALPLAADDAGGDTEGDAPTDSGALAGDDAGAEHEETDDAGAGIDDDAGSEQHDDAGARADGGAESDVSDDAGARTDGGAPDEPPDAGDAAQEEDAGAPDEPDETCADEDTAPPPPGTLPAINADPAFIQVYVNNIENLKTAGEQCQGDWTDLIHYMKTVTPSPDLFLVQQVSDQAQLDLLVQRMTDDLPGIFAGVIADADPWTQGSPCGPEKAQQTNAIIYRTGRFEPVGAKHVWQSWAWKDGGCARNHQARTRNVMQKLRDKVADKIVTVASLHWATAQGTGADPACAKMNVIEADQKLHRADFGGDLLVMGGDANEPDRKADDDLRPWFAHVNGATGGPLHYRDPIYDLCDDGGAAATNQCLDDNWTIGSGSRIDFLLAQDGDGCMPGARRAHTVTFTEGDAAALEVVGTDAPLNYSDHRAVRALLYY